MRNLKEICEGFFDNIGSVSPSIWLSKLKRAKSKLWKDQWAKEYRYKIAGSKLILIHGSDKYVFDFTKGLLWTSLVKFCNSADEYVFTFEPYYEQIRFRLWSKKRLTDGPIIYINFNRNMIAYEMKISNRSILGIDEKIYRCKGYDTSEYISNRALIKYFIESEDTETIKDKINEGFFDNIGGKELIFLQDLKNTLDNWKNSFDKDFPIDLLERLCYKAQRENFNFDICIENNLKSDLKNLYGLIIKFWNGFYEVSEDGRPANNDCWTVYYASSTNTHDIDTFNPKPRTINSNIYRVGDRITHYINTYANGSKRNITFKVRMSLDNPKHTKWI